MADHWIVGGVVAGLGGLGLLLILGVRGEDARIERENEAALVVVHAATQKAIATCEARGGIPVLTYHWFHGQYVPWRLERCE